MSKLKKTIIRGDEESAKRQYDINLGVTNSLIGGEIISPTIDETKYPMSYTVTLHQFEFRGDDESKSRSGIRTTTFTDPDPLYARQDAFIYAAGLVSILKKEYKLGGHIFASEKDINRGGLLNYNFFEIAISLNDNINGNTSLVNNCLGNPADGMLSCLEDEFSFLESWGYVIDNYILVEDSDGDHYRCVNSQVDLVQMEYQQSNEPIIQSN